EHNGSGLQINRLAVDPKKWSVKQSEGRFVDLDFGGRTQLLEELTFGLGALFGRRPPFGLGLDVIEAAGPARAAAERLEDGKSVGRGDYPRDLSRPQRKAGVVEDLGHGAPGEPAEIAAV